MLILSRRTNESILIFPRASVDPDMTVRELFVQGPIEVFVAQANHGQVRIGIDAPQAITVLRSELTKDDGYSRIKERTAI